MNTLSLPARTSAVNTARDARALLEQDHYGYQLYVAKQPIERCTNLLQRRGWASAQRGEMAAADCETAAYLERRQ